MSKESMLREKMSKETRKQSKALSAPSRKNKALAKAHVTKLAKGVVSTIDKARLVEALVSSAKIGEEEAMALLDSRALVSEIHTLLIDSISNGAIAVNAMKVVQDKLDDGNLEAAKLVLSFNKALTPGGVGQVRDVHLHQHLHKELLSLDEKAQLLLAGNPGKKENL